MTFGGVILALHIAAGTVGLVLGPLALGARKRPGLHTRAGETYHWVMLTVCLTAGLMALLDWARLWFFLPIGAFSYAFAFAGYLAAKRRWAGWLRTHISGQGGSYIAMVTALLVVNWESLTGSPGLTAPLAWILPTLIGTPIIAWVNFQVAAGKRPKR